MFEGIEEFDWLQPIVDKIIRKHGVSPQEVEECFFNPPFKLLRGEGVKYYLLGRSEVGRYLFIVYVRNNQLIRVISARDMDGEERRAYTRK